MFSPYARHFFGACALLCFAACGAPSASLKDKDSTPAQSADSASATIEPQAGTNLCLDTSYDSSTDGTFVQVWTCDGKTNQAWSYTNGTLQVFGNKCLQAGTTPLDIFTCDPTNAAQQFTRNGNSLVANDGQCLQINGNAASGATVELGPCGQGNAVQAWTLSAPSSAAPVASSGSNSRTLQVVNKCPQTLYAGAFAQGGSSLPSQGGGWEMAPGSTTTVTLTAPWSGRFWARTGCTFNAAGQGACTTGDCNGALNCTTSAQPASLAEFTFGGWQGLDFYDVSLVEGFNVPIAIAPVPGSFANSNPNSTYSCGTPACAPNLISSCPAALQHTVGGQNVACYNACYAVGGDAYCCSGASNTREACVPNGYSEFFKSACPSAYSYPDDDPTSTFTCQATAYQVTFCP